MSVTDRLGEYCSWSETATKAMVNDGTSMVWWDDHTLHTFLLSTAKNNRSEKECYILVCMFDRVQGQPVLK